MIEMTFVHFWILPILDKEALLTVTHTFMTSSQTTAMSSTWAALRNIWKLQVEENLTAQYSK